MKNSKGSNSTPLEAKLVQMLLPYHHKNGLIVRMQSVMESYSAILIEQGKSLPERLQLLNKLAIRQMEAIQEINTDTIKKLEG